MRIANWDADFIPFYVCHNKRYESGIIEKTLDDCIRGCDDLLANINKSIGADSFVGFITKGKCFRYGIYPEYKGNRKYENMPKYMDEVRSYMIDKYGFLGVQGVEADDLVLSYKKLRKDDEVIIVSPDKDLLNLEGTNYNPRKNEYVTVTADEAATYFWMSMLVGDTADNIKGVKGIGPVTAKTIINNVTIHSSLKSEVLENYCRVYGEDEGITQFYKCYKCLHILDDINKEIFDNVTLNKIEVLSE